MNVIDFYDATPNRRSQTMLRDSHNKIEVELEKKHRFNYNDEDKLGRKHNFEIDDNNSLSSNSNQLESEIKGEDNTKSSKSYFFSQKPSLEYDNSIN